MSIDSHLNESVMKTMTPLEELRHSTAHVLAAAVLRLFPEARLDIGPPTDTGFYYDIDLDHKFTGEDLEAIEAEMKKIIKENQRFERMEVSREEAKEIIRDIGQDRYKLSRLQDIPEGETISFYRNGEFIDLCAGTHVNYTKKIKAFKLLNVAGAYHRGDEKNPQLQRIYGTAFPSREELSHYLEALEEAKKRDHRKIGRDLQLYHIDDSVGSGLILWKPNGAVIRQELQTFIAGELQKQDYRQVFTPNIGKLELFKTSGHFPYYQDSQFPPVVDHVFLHELAEESCSCSELAHKMDEGAIEGYLLKPMNCPFHIKIFDSEPRSYRDLPVRLAEFGTVYRWEQSGELSGLTRVRGFTQDDAHIFCTLGMEDYRVRVGLRDPDSTKFSGDPEKWDRAEVACRNAARTLGVNFTEEPGEAAFYGPKIDFVVKDVLGREWQLGTVQVDYILPDRFDLHYVGADNKNHRPVMIHRAPFGSMERFTGVLIEHFAGNFPLWLAPEQVRVLPVSEKVEEYAGDSLQILKSAGLRASLDTHDEKLGAKIRRAEMDKVPLMLIVGEKEAGDRKVNVRSRIGNALDGVMSMESFVEKAQELIRSRTLPDKT